MLYAPVVRQKCETLRSTRVIVIIFKNLDAEEGREIYSSICDHLKIWMEKKEGT
jgi:hypothetical protein